MSACVEAAPPIASSLPSTDSRAARLARFEREQLIVDYPNRGVSVARIAARVGVGEKRMRAVICDPRTGIRGLARRTPHPPEEFVAIQVGRLNEAPLVAYSAMTGANLKAVDRVVKIVRELHRYHGFVAVERRLPEAPAGGTMAFGAALVSRPEFATQGPEDIGFEWTAPLPLSPPLKRGEGWREGLGRLAAAAYRPAPHLDLLPVNGEKRRFSVGDVRPENPAQDFEKIESAPGVSVPVETMGGSDTARPWTRVAGLDQVGQDAPAADNRPEIFPQTLEKVDSAPGDRFRLRVDHASRPDALRRSPA